MLAVSRISATSPVDRVRYHSQVFELTTIALATAGAAEPVSAAVTRAWQSPGLGLPASRPWSP
jgi:hypothetical protein